MNTHKTPIPTAGYQRVPSRPMPMPRGTIDYGWYRLDSGWKLIVVCSALEDHGPDGVFYHISISKALLGERAKAGDFPADVQHALEAFGMQGAEEDNKHSNGSAHHFWLRVKQVNPGKELAAEPGRL